MLDIHGATHDDVTDASGEELDGPPLFLVPAPFQEEDTPAIHDHEGAGEEDSEVDEGESKHSAFQARLSTASIQLTGP